jgi:hypothetical protein
MIARLGTISSVSTEQHELNKSQSVRESKESHPGEHPRRDVFSLKRRDGRFKLDQSPREDGLWLSLGAN